MDFRSDRLSITEAKQIDLVGYFSSLGFEPANNQGHHVL